MMIGWKRLIGISICCVGLLGGCVSGVRVKKGDTLYSISQKNNVPMRAIIEENKLEAPYTLYPGQYLAFPKGRTHKVRRGDTLYSIAKRYDMSVNSLARLNNIQPPYSIRTGQMLRVSSWTKDAGEEQENKSEKPLQNAGEKSVSSRLIKPPREKPKNELTTGKTAVPQKEKQNEKGKEIVKPPRAPNVFAGKVQVPKTQSGKKFAWPVVGRILSDFGGGNDGINIAGKLGAAVKAAEAGTVAYAGNELKGYGNLVLIRHKEGWITAYAHNSKLVVQKGDVVTKGQKIAEIGNSGNVKSPQLHFEVRYKAKVVNPKQYLP